MTSSFEKVTNPEAKAFLEAFVRNREINRDFYKLVPEDRLDYRMVNSTERKSDSVRESLAHQIDTTRDYVNGIKTGELAFGIKYEDLSNLTQLTKKQLLEKLSETEKELVEILSEPNIGEKMVKVKWSEQPILATSCIWSLNNHEILHQGWNLAVMDHLNIPRYPSLQAMWGK